MKNNPEFIDIILSVDSNEWYYGRKDNVVDQSKKMLVKALLPEDIFLSRTYAKAINSIFIWIQSHEHDSQKRRKRPLYVDRSLFINSKIVL